MDDTAEPWVPLPPDEPYRRYFERCVICGELTSENDIGEMHNPECPEEGGGIVHPDCGLSRGWIVS